jgi:hypothetical protein
MQQFQQKVLDAVGTGTTRNSAAIDASNMLQVSAQCIATGSPTGAVKIQVSNDSPIGMPGLSSSVWTPPNWTDLAGATIAVTSAASFLLPKTDICYQFIRFVYTGSGTGTVTVNIKANCL